MNTSKNNIEHQIKKQISEREITPSRDLWSEIESQSVEKTPKPKMNWLLAAACLILTFSLGAVLFIDEENSEIEKSKITAEIKKSIIQDKTEFPAVNSLKVAEQKQNESFAAQNTPAEKSKQYSHPQTIVENKDLPLTKNNAPEIIASISKIKPENIFAKSDSAKIQIKKKRYVDPSTLLFSVEHKDVIEKTKEGSNVATIDVNLR